MHRGRRVFFVALSAMAPLGFATEIAVAQDWLWPFGSGRAAVQRHRHLHSTFHTMRTADVPLPVPRPRFASDGKDEAHPEAAPTIPTAAVPLQSSPAAAPNPPKTEAADGRTPPMPAPKPADLEAPQSADHETAKSAPAHPDQGQSPAVVPGSGATTAFTPRQPADDQTCFDRLVARKVDVQRTVIGPQPDSRCTVVEPVRLLGLTLADGSHVTFPDRPTIACATADAFSDYVHDLVAPLAKGSYGASLVSVGTGVGLECRARDSIAGAKLSAHGQGLAVDIAQIRLASGRSIEVGAPKDDIDKAFETAARAGGCGYFHTVLGPGSDAYHRTHWHFDLLVRGKNGDDKYCK